MFGEQFVLQRARRPCRLGWAQHLGPHTPLLGPAPPWTLMPYWLLPSGDDAQEQAAAQEVGLSCGPEHRSPPATGPRWEPSHPRRTRMVRFTCRLCGTRTARWVNPHAWQRGSVFARCRGCEVVHKLVDNLEVRRRAPGGGWPAAEDGAIGGGGACSAIRRPRALLNPPVRGLPVAGNCIGLAASGPSTLSSPRPLDPCRRSLTRPGTTCSRRPPCARRSWGGSSWTELDASGMRDFGIDAFAAQQACPQSREPCDHTFSLPRCTSFQCAPLYPSRSGKARLDGTVRWPSCRPRFLPRRTQRPCPSRIFPARLARSAPIAGRRGRSMKSRAQKRGKRGEERE